MTKSVLLGMFICVSSALGDTAIVRFCADTESTDRRTTVSLVLHNVESGKDTNIGALNYSRPRTISVSIEQGNYQIGGAANGGTRIKPSHPIALRSGDSFGVGVIVWGDASLTAELILKSGGSCPN